MSAGVALAWATEALRRASFPRGNPDSAEIRRCRGLCAGVETLGSRSNDFYRLLGQGTLKRRRNTGADFACVLGQEMGDMRPGGILRLPGAGLRHSHLDAGGYSYDQKQKGKDAAPAVEFLVQDEKARVLLTSMVSCLFAGSVQRGCAGRLFELRGLPEPGGKFGFRRRRIQKMRWQIRMKTGFEPGSVKIPERFKEVVTWKGAIDTHYLNSLQTTYAKGSGRSEFIGER